MQYGNLISKQLNSGKTLFKSYYVVWKHSSNPDKLKHVLCLNRTMQYGNLKNNITDDERKESLNRTMQYGNETASQGGRSGAKMFKSYYVVWKLLFKPYKKGWIITV